MKGVTRVTASLLAAAMTTGLEITNSSIRC